MKISPTLKMNAKRINQTDGVPEIFSGAMPANFSGIEDEDFEGDFFRSLLTTIDEFPRERVFMELKKLLLKSVKPSVGFEIADEIGMIQSLFPELFRLQGVPQDQSWHPEGDVWKHTLLVLDQAAALRNGDEFQDLCLMLAALCHDLGKPDTTKWTDGRWTSHGHAESGESPTRKFLGRLTNETKLIEATVSLVIKHLIPLTLYKSHLERKVGSGAIRRLSLKVDIPLLVKLARADLLGRGESESADNQFAAGEWLLQQHQNLRTGEELLPEPILRGRDLLNLDMIPGPKFGKILNQVYELQLDKKILTFVEAIEWVKSNGS